MKITTAAFGIAVIRAHQRTSYIKLRGNCSKASRVHLESININNDANGGGSNPRARPSNADALLQLAQSHFVAQTLLAFVQLGIPDVLDTSRGMTVDEIINQLENHRHHSIQRDPLFRCLRLLCTAGVVKEKISETEVSPQSVFLLTDVGKLLQTSTSQSMAPFVHHWMDAPLWNAWQQLPDYLAGNAASCDPNAPPFDVANGMTASEYYSNNENSRIHRNAVARYASSREITSILHAICSNSSPKLNEEFLAKKRIVDIGGGYGDLSIELKRQIGNVGACYCLDLPDVIQDAKLAGIGKGDSVQLVPGDMFEHTTIPKCDVIFTKHVLCDFSDYDVVRALNSFHKVLSRSGKVVICDAVLPNGEDLNGKWNSAVSFDVLLMLSGRRGERSRLEWSNLAQEAGFVLEGVMPTSSVTVYMAIFTKKEPVDMKTVA